MNMIGECLVIFQINSWGALVTHWFGKKDLVFGDA